LAGRPIDFVPIVHSSATLPASVEQALRNGNKIEAIKLFREATGVGLKEAKEAVEAMEAQGAPTGMGISRDKAKAGPLILLLVGAIVIAILAYYYRAMAAQ
jgi:ribosomal protein L7/L12